AAVDQDGGGAGGDAGGDADVGRVDALPFERFAEYAAESVVVNAADHVDRRAKSRRLSRAESSGGDGLVGALAAGEDEGLGGDDGLSGRGDSRDAVDEVGV